MTLLLGMFHTRKWGEHDMNKELQALLLIFSLKGDRGDS